MVNIFLIIDYILSYDCKEYTTVTVAYSLFCNYLRDDVVPPERLLLLLPE